jgi:hypothetical protein
MTTAGPLTARRVPQKSRKTAIYVPVLSIDLKGHQLQISDTYLGARTVVWIDTVEASDDSDFSVSFAPPESAGTS